MTARRIWIWIWIFLKMTKLQKSMNKYHEQHELNSFAWLNLRTVNHFLLPKYAVCNAHSSIKYHLIQNEARQKKIRIHQQPLWMLHFCLLKSFQIFKLKPLSVQRQGSKRDHQGFRATDRGSFSSEYVTNMKGFQTIQGKLTCWFQKILHCSRSDSCYP